MMDGNVGHHDPYRPLLPGQLRVLELHPGEKSSPLVAELRSIYLPRQRKANRIETHQSDQLQECESDADPSFEAVSYCWGVPEFTEILRFASGGTLHITPSLYTVLQAFRYSDRTRVLWADAICINQQDVIERSAQVAMMGEIYAGASRVLVWLGEPSLNGTEVLAFTTLYAGLEEDQRRRDRPELRLPMDEVLKFLEYHLHVTSCCACCGEEMLSSKPSAMEGLVSVGKLLDRPWFTRLWVVQEVALAGAVEVYCGTHHAPWENFRAVIYHLWSSRLPGWPLDSKAQTDEFSESLPLSRLQWMWEQFIYFGYYRTNATQPFVPSNFFQGIINLSTRLCVAPHDRIFSVRSIFGLGGIEALRPNYSIPAAEIYRRATLLCLTSPSYGVHRSFMLALTGTETTSISPMSLPSWVPDLHRLSNRSHAKYMRYEATIDGQFCADDAAFKCQISTSDIHELLVRGSCFAEIERILDDSICPAAYPEQRSGGTSHPEEEGIAIIRWYLRCRRFLLANAKLTDLYVEADHDYYMSKDEQLRGIDQEIYSITCADDVPDIPKLDMVDSNMFAEWVSKIPLLELDPILDEGTLRRSLRPFISGQAHSRYDRERHMCCTRGEFGALAGWVPITARPGDVICHFTGAPFPFVLRRNGDETFTLLGDAYIHGVEERSVLHVDPGRWRDYDERRRKNQANVEKWNKEISQARLSHETDTSERRKHAIEQRNMYASASIDLADEAKELYREAGQGSGWVRLR